MKFQRDNCNNNTIASGASRFFLDNCLLSMLKIHYLKYFRGGVRRVRPPLDPPLAVSRVHFTFRKLIHKFVPGFCFVVDFDNLIRYAHMRNTC